MSSANRGRPVRHREEILYAEVHPRHLRGPRWQLDVAGHYGRPDVFALTVRREPRPMVRVMDEERKAGGEPPHFPNV
jgi:nitrilase